MSIFNTILCIYDGRQYGEREREVYKIILHCYNLQPQSYTEGDIKLDIQLEMVIVGAFCGIAQCFAIYVHLKQ